MQMSFTFPVTQSEPEVTEILSTFFRKTIRKMREIFLKKPTTAWNCFVLLFNSRIHSNALNLKLNWLPAVTSNGHCFSLSLHSKNEGYTEKCNYKWTMNDSENIFHAQQSFIEWVNVEITILILIMRPFNGSDYFKMDGGKMNRLYVRLCVHVKVKVVFAFKIVQHCKHYCELINMILERCLSVNWGRSEHKMKQRHILSILRIGWRNNKKKTRYANLAFVLKR